MIDLKKRIDNDVRDCLAQACQRLGIDKSEVGVYVGGGGVVAPQVIVNPETGEKAIVGFAPTWQITVSIRHRLIGREPVAGSLPVYDVLPTRAMIEPIVTRLLSDVHGLREKQFNEGA